VVKKLELTADQKAKLKNVGDEARQKLAELNSANNNQPPDDQRRPAYMQRLSEITAERKNQSIALLTDEQRAKFEKLQGKKFDTSTIQPNRRKFTSRGRIDAPFPQPPSAQ
jgi:Spy/CpxP family protein refolding chaperone